MTARDVGGIVCRALALYVSLIAIRVFPGVVLGIQDFFSASSSLRPDMVRFMIQSVLTFVLYGFGALLLWVKSSSFWPSENRIEPPLDTREWQRILFLLLGAYFLIEGTAASIYNLTVGTNTSIRVLRTSEYDAFRDGFQAVIGLAIVIWNAKPRAPLIALEDQNPVPDEP